MCSLHLTHVCRLNAGCGAGGRWSESCHVRGKKDYTQGTGVLSLLVSLVLADVNELPHEIQQMRSVGGGGLGTSRANMKATHPYRRS